MRTCSAERVRLKSYATAISADAVAAQAQTGTKGFFAPGIYTCTGVSS